MLKVNQIALLVLLILTLASSAPVVTTPSTPTSYCNNGGTTKWTFDKLTQTSTPASIDFDESSAFRDLTTGDSVAVMVKKSVGAEPFKLMTLNKNTLEPTMKACAGSAGYEFVSLISQFLFLKNVDKYYYCLFDLKLTATEFPLVLIKPPTVSDFGGTISQFGPLSAYQENENNFAISTVWGDA